ncbi:adhesin [Pseudomonas sp. M30-35]|uniref:adhesin n=1 Tax=Pseudomonas sp. M30-35 TaxID=1981174 RepID=UPI000B3C4764|nr:adhesin [Pseudomonas sp. M30-35]
MKSLPLLIALAISTTALADGSPASMSQATISSSASHYQGVVSVNQAAGEWQQQSNARALAVGNGASASTQQIQNLNIHNVDRSQAADVAIEAGAFNSGNGVLGINQSAGAGTQQANAMSISVSSGLISLDDSMLSQNVAITQISGAVAPSTGERRVATDDTAFVGSRGVVQLNQSAGVGNRMGNNLSIRVSD